MVRRCLIPFRARRPTTLDKVGQEPIALAIGAVEGCLDTFSHQSFFFLSLLETTRYRLKY